MTAVAQDFVFREFGGRWFGRRGYGATGDARDDRHGVAILHRGGVLFQIADVFVVQIDVDEAAQLAFIVEELTAQIRVVGGEGGQHFAYGRAGQLDGILFACVLAQRCGY